MKRSAIRLGLLAAFTVWVLHILGVFLPFDILAYEAFMRLNVSLSAKQSPVLLIECHQEEGSGSEEGLLKTLDVLERLGVEQVVFTFVPERASSRFYEEASRRQVVFGRQLLVDAAAPEESKLAPLPAAASGHDLLLGVVTLPPSTNGICRQQDALIWAEGRSWPAVEVEAARCQEMGVGGDARYLVNFRGGAGSLPHFTLDYVLAGRLVRELVQGRTALIGLNPGAAAPGLFTPTTQGDQPMSLLEYQGHALDTLLTGRALRAFSPLGSLLVLLLITVIAALLHQWLEIRLALWSIVALLAVQALLALVLFTQAYRWLPFVELILAQLVCFFLVFRKKAVTSYRAVSRLLFGLSSELQERYATAGFYTSPEHWSLVANFVTQTLDLNRVIFMEKVERQNRVREVKSFHCTFADIHEARRDFTRVPYRTAIEAQGPIRVDGTRMFFKKVREEEHHYLVPLTFAGQVLGFWVLAVDPAKASAIPHFAALLRDFAEQIAELLYRRQQVSAEQSEPSLWKRLLAFTSEGEVYQELGHKAALLERRLGRMEKLFAELDTPLIVYDLFGRVKEASTAMARFLVQEGLLPFETTAVDMVAGLTGCDLAVARRCLRHVIIEKGQIILPVKPRAHPGNFVLKLGPLEPRPHEAILDDPTPFNLSGIRCELHDRTLLSQLDKLKDKIAERLGVQLRDDLAAIDQSASRMASDSLVTAQRREIADSVHAQVRHAVDTLADCEMYFAVDAQGDGDRFPLDPRASFEAAQARIAALAQDHRVTLQLEAAPVLDYVLATPDHLRRLFEHALTYLIKDARPQSTLHVQVQPSDRWITYTFKNEGFGMSPERFQDSLFGAEEAVSADFRNLRADCQRVRLWGGQFEAGSKLGEGTYLSVALQKFG